MSRTSYLAKNVGLLTISSFSTKLLAFFLVPFYTSVLSTTDYGTFDLFNTTISLIIPIITLGITTSLLRFAMDKESDKVGVFSFGLKFFLISSGIVSILLVINYLFSFNDIIKENSWFVLLMFMATELNGMVSNFTRGLENIKAIAIAGIIGTLVTAGFNILFLLPFHMGLRGYLLAWFLGSVVHILFLFFDLKLWRYISFKKIDKQLKKQMLSYSKPLVANDISWWVNNVSDRYIVTWLCGVGVNGIYSVGYKIPSLLSMMQGIFSQAWTLSAIKDYNSKDSSEFFSKMYSLYNFVLVCSCSVLIITARFFAHFLYAKDFFAAWKYIPFLLISVIFGALSGYVGAIFGAVKDTRMFGFSSVLGAISNIFLNIILVRYIGALGAAISTAVSYCITWVLRMITVRKYVSMNISFVKDIFCYLLLVIQSVYLICHNEDSFYLYIIEIGLFFLVIFANMKNIKLLVEWGKNKYASR